MKVLVWKIGALGDVVMSTPLVRQLRRNLPHAQIDYLVGRSFRSVLQGNPHLDRVLDFDEATLFEARPSALPKVLALLRGYDLIFVLDKHWIFTWLAFLSRIPRRIGYRRRAIEGWPLTVAVPYGALRHEIDYHLDLLEAASFRVDRADTQLELPQMAPFVLRGPYVVAINAGGSNPGESSAVRRLPESLFEGLVAQLSRCATVVFLGSPSERAYYDRFEERYGAVNLCGAITLPQSWSVLAAAQAVYTTDSGLMHMAGAVNHRVLAIFGPSHPLRKCPPGARWIWKDEALHDPHYELQGRVPKGKYFSELRLDEILVAACWPPTGD